MLAAFLEWHDIFEDEYCEKQCDDCPFFFKKGCMMMLLKELVDMTFHTKELKKVELNRIQDKNQETEKEWARQLHEAIEKSKKT
jgi:hypothetical protein